MAECAERLRVSPETIYAMVSEGRKARLLEACGIAYNPKLDHFIPDVRCEHLKPIMRVGEILALKWAQVDFVQRIIQVESYKTYPMPISERLYAVLYKLKTTSSGEHVFCDKLTNRPFGSIKRAFKTACERAKIKGIRFHDLRHTFASRLRAKGVDLVTIKELLGHADIRTTLRYAHTNMDAKKAAILALTGHKLVTDAEFGGSAPPENNGINIISPIT